MLRLAVLSARGRLGAFTGALIALFAAAVLSMAWGMQLESILHTHSPVARIQRSGRLVGEHHLGPSDERPGDSNTLLLAAGELSGTVA